MGKIIFWALMFTYFSCGAKILVVPTNFATIQKAIDKSSVNDTVLVEAGTYEENLSIENKNISLISNYSINKKEDYIIATVIDGKELNSVITIRGDSSRVLIEGFTIQNGKFESGGGIFIDKAYATLKNLSIIQNSAKFKGGGIFGFSSEVVIEDLEISGNSTFGVGAGGGGICFMDSQVKIIESNIHNNSAYVGGGIYCNNSVFTIIETKVETNTARNKGGGLYFFNSTDPNLIKIKILNNTVTNPDGTGGGLCFESSDFIMAFCEIGENISDNGGGIFVSYCTPKIMNSLFYKNKARCKGGAIKCDHADPKLINVTIADNSAGIGGALHNTRNSQLIITNCILWENIPDEILIDYTSNYSIQYSNIFSKITGKGNIKVDPQFEEAVSNNYKLKKSSPCKNIGNPNTKYNNFDGSRNDIGAYGGKKGKW